MSRGWDCPQARHPLHLSLFICFESGQNKSHLRGGEGVPVVRQREQAVQELHFMAVDVGYLTHNRPRVSAV